MVLDFDEKLKVWMKLDSISILENHQNILTELVQWWKKIVQVSLKFLALLELTQRQPLESYALATKMRTLSSIACKSSMLLEFVPIWQPS